MEERHIVASLSKDPIFNSHELDANAIDIDVNRIMETESELSSELYDLNNLKVLSSLIREFNTNLELLEFENCYYSLQNLRKKISENNEAFIKQSFHFQRSVVVYVDSLHTKYVNTIHDIITTGFWKISSHSIKFRSTITWGKDNFDIEHDILVELLQRLFYPNDMVDPTLWLITDMEFGNDREMLKTQLVDIYKNYVKFDEITRTIKNAIFGRNIIMKYNPDEDLLQFVSDSTTIGATGVLASFDALDEFLLNSIPKILLGNLLKNIGDLLGNEFLKFVRGNAPEIIGSNNDSLKQQVGHVNEQLGRLSQDSNGLWSYNEQNIDELLKDKQLYINLLLDKVFLTKVQSIRSIFNDSSNNWKKVTVVQLPSATGINTQSTQENESSKQPPNNADGTDGDWNWDAADADDAVKTNDEELESIGAESDDAWGDEIDVDLDLQSPKKLSNSGNTKPSEDIAEEDENGGWEEDWDIGEDDIDEKPTDKSNKPSATTETSTNLRDISENSITEVTVTQLPKLFSAIVAEFIDEARDIEDNMLQNTYFTYKLSLLQTTFFAIAVAHCPPEWWMVFVDMRETYKDNIKLFRLQELSARYLESNRLIRQKRVWKLIQQQLQEFHEKENSPSWSITLEELIPFIQTEIISPLIQIGGEESDRELIRFLQFLFTNCITDVILKWDIISEKNSENLGKLISLISSNVEVPSLGNSPQYKEMCAKFDLVGRFLPLHLREITDMFYNGDFYLFSTEEIVLWIKLLFADTPIRKDAISDIYEIRQAATEDN